MAQPRAVSASGPPEPAVSDVRSCVAEVLGLPEHEVDPAALLIHLGLESFTAVRLRRRLRERTGVDLPFTEFFGRATCLTLAAGVAGPAPAVVAPDQRTARPAPRTAGPGVPGAAVARHEARLPAARWAALCEQAAAHQRSTVDTLCAALGLTLARWLGRGAAVHAVLIDGDARTEWGPAELPAPDLPVWKGFAQYAEQLPDPADAAPQASAPELRQVVRADEHGAHIAWEPVADAHPGAPEMFSAYLRLLARLADPDAWNDVGLGWDPTFAEPEPPVATPFAVAGPLLDDPVRQAARRDPAAAAILDSSTALSHGELAAVVSHNATVLGGRGIGPGDLVAVVSPKGPAQIVAVLSVAATGAGFVPVEPSWPAARVAAVCAAATIRHAVTAPDARRLLPPQVRAHGMDVTGRLTAGAGRTHRPGRARPADLAYVIFTSGSTGTPKGVAIEHRAARTTIDDITDRFAVRATDRVLALSALSFDLSIYDIFGVLAAGGALVLPEASRQRDPAHWLDLMAAHRVTIWNTAPALMEMLVEEAEGRPAAAGRALAALRLVLLSGDWIPVTLPDRLRALAPQARIVSLGGATEASIWSICHPVAEVDPAATSIPYGRALRGQTFHVLDPDAAPCPVGVAGELYIGGAGLARGYLGDPAQTAARFVHHEALGERLYRTGDLGRWRPDGTIEFLGRMDRQVKIRGHRIELGEIESVLNRLPAVRQCVAVTVPGPAGAHRLAAYVVPRRPTEPPSRAALVEQLRDQLPEYMVPAAVVVLDRLPVTANGKVDYRALPQLRAEHLSGGHNGHGPDRIGGQPGA